MEGFDQYPVQCYNLTAEESNTEMFAALAVLKKGDTIKVKGRLKNYINSYNNESTKEFDEGCLLLDYIAAPEPDPVTWTKVEWDAVTAEDVIAVTMSKEIDGVRKYWVLPGSNGTASAPTAVEVTVTDNKITTKGSDEFGWVKEAVEESEGYSLRLATTTNQYLHFTKDDNNVVRVGAVEAFPFQVTDSGTNGTHLTGTISGTKRFVGVYITNAGVPQDWRCYKLGSTGGFPNNVKSQTVEFWKLGEGGEQPPEKTDQQKVEEQAAALVLSEGPYEEATVVTLPLPELYPETTILWSSESPLAVVDEAQEKLTITLPEDEDKIVPVKAALTLGTGSTERTFNLQIKKAEEAPVIYETVEDILKALYALGDNEVLSDGYLYELEGKITKVNTAFEEANFRISVTIVMEGFDNYPVMAFRLTAEDEDMKAALPNLKVNDTIKVKGKLKNYNGTREFDAGCLLLAYTEGEAVVEEEYTWIKSSWDEVNFDEVFAITMSKDGLTYILTGINGSSATPPAKTVTVSEDGQTMTTLGLDENSWLKEETEDGTKLRWGGEKDFYLNTKDKNNELRVSNRTGDDVYSIVSLNTASNYLTISVSETVTRYVGVYFTNGVAQDFRTYNSMHTNISGETLGIWKLKDGGDEPPVGTTDEEKIETEYLNLSLGPISVGPGIVSQDMTYPLPLEGGTYAEVKIAWESDAANVAVVDGNLVITQIETEVVAHVKATLTLNSLTREKTFTVTVTAKESGGEAEEVTEKIVASEQGYANAEVVTEVAKGNIKVTFTKGTNDPCYYTSGSGYRVYNGGSITVSTVDGSPLNKIVFTFAGTSYTGNIPTDENYTLEGTVGTWTGSANSVTFEVKATTRLQVIEATYIK